MENVIIAESGINLHGSNLSDYLGAALGAQVSQMPPSSPLFCDASWVGSPGKQGSIELFAFLSAWNRRLN